MTRQRYFLLILPLLFLGWTSMTGAQQVSVDFRQAANNHKPNPLGSVYWVNGALQRQNAVYYEGMSVPQRVAFMNVRATAGNQHTLTFDHLTARSGKHAYDFLTSYDQAMSAAQAIAGAPVLAQLNECGPQMGPPATLQTACNTVRGFGYSALVDIPDAMGSVNGRSVAQRIAAYEARFGNRTLRIFGNAPITSAVLVFNGYASGPNPYAEYTLQWTSASTTILVEMAAHLAMGTDVQNAGTGVGYGAGLGAGSINGASYHVRLSRLDGASLGNRDNQIQGTAIRTNIVCSATGPSTVCAGTQNVYSMVTTTAGTISWSLSNNTSNASILGSTSGPAINVHTGNGQGGFVVNATASDGIQTVQCAVPVQINAPSVTVSATPIVCGGATSTVTVTATGGTPPYTGTGTFSLPAGTHSISVSDANNCTTTTSVTITEPPLLTVNATAGSTSCTGGQSTVIVTASGGTPPYIGTGSFPRTPGTHTFTVTDANGCTASTSVTVSSSSSLAATATAAPLPCNGGTTSVTVAASGGTPPYTGTGTFTRGAGTYSFTVTDANNCSATSTVTITAPAAISATATAAPLSCGNGTTTVTVAATGGTPPYTGTGAFTRGPGTYTFTVTDANNCTGTATVTITAPPVLSITASAAPLACGNGTTPVTVAATGGTPPYTGTGTFPRGTGTFTFTVTDANNCTGTATVTITAPPALSATASASAITCGGGTSTVTVSASGGTPPYTGTGTFTRGAGTYSFTVTDANNCSATSTVTITAPAAISATATAAPLSCGNTTTTVTVAATGGTPPYTGTGAFSRGAGTHTFTVTDANNCTGTATVTITAAPAISVTAIADPLLCGNGTTKVTVTATGGTAPYTGTGFFARGAGTHTFTVTDANNCTGTATVTITGPAAISVTATAPTLYCSNGTTPVTVAATGGTPPYSGTGVFARSTGTHTFTVTDANNCTGTATITITAPASVVATASATRIDCSGGTSTVTIAATGGTPPYTGTGSFQRAAGTWNFTVTDAANCSATTSITITEPAQLTASATSTVIGCNGGSSSVTVNAAGGTPPYTGTGTFSRGAGTHTFTVTDANNCTAQVSVLVTQPAAVSVTATATPIGCNGGTSTVTVAAAGGTPPYTGIGSFPRTAGTYTFTVTDANNCSGTASVTITQPASITVTATAPPLLCSSATTPVTVAAAGGVGPYTGTGTFMRSAGTHTFTVTDANNCSAQTTITITAPSSVSATATATPIDCNGGMSTVTVTAAGGTPPYTGTGVFSRGAGTHTFTVTDANSCSMQATVTITEPAALVAAATSTPIACNGGTSAVTVTATGGVGPYRGTGTFTRSAGTYSFTVTDANNCTSQVSVQILEPAALVATSSATAIICNGGPSTITVSATGGTPPYTGTGVFQRGAGIYTFTVTDVNNCQSQTSVNISEPSPVIAYATSTPIDCQGGTSTVTITAAGGTPPYTGIGTFTRGAGTYSFTVTDANNCSGQVSITITEPPALTVVVDATPIACNAGTSTITVTAAGGTPPYTGTGVFVRGAGYYTFTVTDSKNCSASMSIGITQPNPLVAVANATPILCNGGMSTVTVTATGGTLPYTGTGVFQRGAGIHTFTVIDANSCTTHVTITISEPSPVIAYATATPILCAGDLSTVTITAAGGTPPYSGVGQFSRPAGTHGFTVTDSKGCTGIVTITITEPPALVTVVNFTPILCNGDLSTVTISGAGGTPPYIGVGIVSRGAGTHTFTITDVNGCTASRTITITQPPVLTALANAQPIQCNGELTVITVTAAGGTAPYSGTGQYIRGAGTYSFTVTDFYGCRATVSITVTEPAPLVAASSGPNLLCGNDLSNINVTASGGTPPYSGTGVFPKHPGTYTFTVTDANGCKAYTTITIAGPPALVAAAAATDILCNGGNSTVTVTASGGTPPYSGTGTFLRRAGQHTFTVIDANGCRDSVTISISEPPPLMIACSVTPNCVNGMRTVSVNATGGTPPYTYIWSPGNSTGPTMNVPCTMSGRITVIVRDANWNPADPNNSSCEATCMVTLDLVAPDDSSSTISRSMPNGGSEPTDGVLLENYPNPFNPSTTIRYTLPEASRVRLIVLNMLGQLQSVLVDAEVAAGSHVVPWSATDDEGRGLPTGRYLYRLHAVPLSGAPEIVRERLMLLVK